MPILAAVLTEVHQRYLAEARQMQALSFSVHIPLVCFGIAFPAMIMFAEWLHRRTGDETYRTLARRWTRIAVALFAVGVITGTILSFEMGLLWPRFTATFGSVFGLGFAIEGFSFFTEAIFLGIYVYGWRRLSPRAHFLSGIPVVVSGFTGSLMVIAVNAWMNHPTGFALSGGHVVDVHPLHALFGNPYLWSELIHMYVAGFMVCGFLVAGAYAVGRLRDRRPPTRYERAALAIPLTIACLAAPVQVLIGDWLARDVAVDQPVKLAAIEGLYRTTRGASEHVLGWYEDGQVKYGIAIPHLLSLLAFHSWDAPVKGLATVPAAQRPPVNVVRVAFQLMVSIGTMLALLGTALPSCAHSPATDARIAVVSPGGDRSRTAGHRGPDLRLGDDRGRSAAVGRLPGDANRRRGHRRGRDPGRVRRAAGRLCRGRGWSRVGAAAVGADAIGRGRGAPTAWRPAARSARRGRAGGRLSRCSRRFRSSAFSGAWSSTSYSPEPTSGPDCGCCRRVMASTATGCASTPIMRWGRYGRPTMCG